MSRRRTPISLPFEPLATFLAGPEATGRRLALLAHEVPSNVQNWRRAGRVPFYSADRLACRLGVHPSAIWSTYWETAVEALDD